MNDEVREALDAQSVDMDRLKDDIRGLQGDVQLISLLTMAYAIEMSAHFYTK